MPCRSFKQDAFMHAQHPDIAKRWDAETKKLRQVEKDAKIAAQAVKNGN